MRALGPSCSHRDPGLAGTMRRLERGDRFPVDLATAQARAEDFDAVVLPGGAANSDRLRA